MRCALILPGLLASCSLYAQQAAPAPATPAPYTLKISSRRVVLDVIVLDKAGKPVRGLDSSQFTVLENNVPQTLRSFEESTPAAAGVDAKTINNTEDLRKFGGTRPVDIIVFDELNSKFEDMAYSRNMVEKFINRQPEKLPVPTQLLAAGDTHFAVLQDYTQNRKDLLDALNKHMPQYPWQMMRDNSSGEGALERMAQTLGVLSQIADASSGTPGRKNVIWIGTGYPGVDTTTMDEDDQAKMLPAIKTVTSRMMASRVTLYVVDPTGVHGVQQDAGADPDGNPDASAPSSLLGPFNGPLDFTSFASATGGEVFSERNDLDGAIDEGLHEAANYYTLSYAPTDNSDIDTKFRKIRIVMKDKSLHAVTRNGYFPGPAPIEAAPQPKQKSSDQLKWDMASAAQTNLVYNGLDLRPQATPQGYTLAVVARDLTWTDAADGSRTADVTVMAIAYDAKGKQLRHESQELHEKIGSKDNIEQGQRAGFSFAFHAPAKTARIRFVMRDSGNGKMGSSEVHVE